MRARRPRRPLRGSDARASSRDSSRLRNCPDQRRPSDEATSPQPAGRPFGAGILPSWSDNACGPARARERVRNWQSPRRTAQLTRGRHPTRNELPRSPGVHQLPFASGIRLRRTCRSGGKSTRDECPESGRQDLRPPREEIHDRPREIFPMHRASTLLPEAIPCRAERPPVLA